MLDVEAQPQEFRPEIADFDLRSHDQAGSVFYDAFDDPVEKEKAENRNEAYNDNEGNQS
jgi:hypothetical protein